MDTISSSSHLFVKLVWNSAVGSEDSLDVQMALYKTSLVKNFLRNVFSEAQSCQSFAQESYDKKYSQWKNSLKSSNDETNKTKGPLKKILAPDCNAYLDGWRYNLYVADSRPEPSSVLLMSPAKKWILTQP